MPALRVAKAGHSQGSAVSSSNLQQEGDNGEALWLLWQQGHTARRGDGEKRRARPTLWVAKAGNTQGRAVPTSHLQQE